MLSYCICMYILSCYRLSRKMGLKMWLVGHVYDCIYKHMFEHVFVHTLIHVFTQSHLRARFSGDVIVWTYVFEHIQTVVCALPPTYPLPTIYSTKPVNSSLYICVIHVSQINGYYSLFCKVVLIQILISKL